MRVDQFDLQKQGILIAFTVKISDVFLPSAVFFLPQAPAQTRVNDPNATAAFFPAVAYFFLNKVFIRGNRFKIISPTNFNDITRCVYRPRCGSITSPAVGLPFKNSHA